MHARNGMGKGREKAMRAKAPAHDHSTSELAQVNKLLKQEIAHRRRAEEANAKFAAIVENSNDAIIGQKLDGTIVTWNKGAEQIFGHTTDEACGRSVSILAPPDRIDESARMIQAIRRGELVQHFETERLRKDGRRIDVSLTVSPIRDSTGRIVGASLIARDITQRKEIERALRESEAKARGILDTAVDAIITISERGIVESFNNAAEQLFGYAASEVIGKNVSMLMPEPYHSSHDTYLQNYLRTKVARIIGIGREVLAQRKDGTTFPADLAVSEVTLAERRLFTGVVRDLSERKRLEREVLEISDRERRSIGQDMHDSLGQLLTGIGFKTKSLQNKLAAKGGAESESAGRIASLVTQAISEARALAHGLQPVDAKPTGLMSALQALAISVQDLFKVNCRFECPKPIEIRDPAAATHLYRIAQEACNNAVKHAKASQITILLTRSDGALALSIRNDGLDYNPSSTSAKGMGLQIMRYRAGIINASISIQRAEGGGTVVTCESTAL